MIRTIWRLWRIDLNVTELTCRTLIVTQVVPVMRTAEIMWVLVLATCLSMSWKLILICWRLHILCRFLGVFSCLWKLVCAVNSGYSSRARWSCHLNWILLLWLHLKILNLLHNHVRKTELDNLLILSDCCYLVVIVVSSKQILYGLSTECSEVLFKLFILNVSPLFINIFLVKVVLLGWYERRL